MTAVENARQFAAIATANGTLVAGKHNPVDATSGARTVSLPVPTTIGAHLSVEKRDASTNTVTVTGSIRGTAGSLVLGWQYESVTFRWDGLTWVPTEGHKTKASLDGAYSPKDSQAFNISLAGADRTGATDASAAFAAAASAAKNAAHLIPGYSLDGDKRAGIVIDVPPGDYLITTPGAFLGNEGIATQANGIRWRGAGDGITNIIFRPAAAGALIADTYWQNIQIDGMSFFCETPGSTVIAVDATHAAQHFKFDNVAFYGWRYIADATGSNNASEWMFTRIGNHFMAANGAFIHIGAGGSDQFLNFWLDKVKHWSTSAPLIDATYGGHFHLRDIDVSAFAAGAATPTYLFKLFGNTHSLGVCVLKVDGLRVEGMSPSAALLYSEWPQGTVDIDSDWSSQVYARTFGDIIKIVYGNIDGPNYRFTGQLAGGINVSWLTSGFGARQILVENATWWNAANPAAVVTYDTSGAAGNTNRPAIKFINTRGAILGSPATSWSTTGASDLFTAADGTPLSNQWATSFYNQGVAPTGTIAINTNRARITTAANANATAIADLVGMAPQGDTDVRVQLVPTAGTYSIDIGINANGDRDTGAGGNTAAGTYLDITYGSGGVLGFYRGGSLISAEVPKAIAAGTTYTARVQRIGLTVQGKVWTGATEPAAWDITTTLNVVPPTGHVTLGVWNGASTASTVDFDTIIVA